MKIQTLFSRGLWPFTPDPAPSGLLQTGLPLLICGNSRHEQALILRHLRHLQIGIAALDCAGCSLLETVKIGNLTLESLSAALKLLAEPSSDPSKSRVALLPYRAWQALGGADLQPVEGWVIQPAPDDPARYRAFLRQDCRLDERMKHPSTPLGERLQAGLAHWGLFAVMAAIGLIWFGWLVWLSATLMGLAASITAALTIHRGESRLAAALPVMALAVLAVLVGALAGVITSSLPAAGAWLGAQGLAGLWMMIGVRAGRAL